MIKFENVTKIYERGARPALDDVSLDIDRGEFTFLVGASGSGKSTLLSCVMREERVNAGTILVAGHEVTRLSTRKIPIFRRQIGVVFQDFRLLLNKTVFDNVAFAMEVIGKPRHAILGTVPEVLRLVGLDGKEKRLPHELSGGEQQRVALARAVVNRPLILLADEPTGNLDPHTSEGIMRVLDRINQTGTTIVMATHDEEIVNKMRRRVIELVDGRVIRDEHHGGYESAATVFPGETGFIEAVREEVRVPDRAATTPLPPSETQPSVPQEMPVETASEQEVPPAPVSRVDPQQAVLESPQAAPETVPEPAPEPAPEPVDPLDQFASRRPARWKRG